MRHIAVAISGLVIAAAVSSTPAAAYGFDPITREYIPYYQDQGYQAPGRYHSPGSYRPQGGPIFRQIVAYSGGQAPGTVLDAEIQVLGLVAGGRSNREIGAALFISEHTAANHIRSILRKTACANRTEAASYAHRRNLAGT